MGKTQASYGDGLGLKRAKNSAILGAWAEGVRDGGESDDLAAIAGRIREGTHTLADLAKHYADIRGEQFGLSHLIEVFTKLQQPFVIGKISAAEKCRRQRKANGLPAGFKVLCEVSFVHGDSLQLKTAIVQVGSS